MPAASRRPSGRCRSSSTSPSGRPGAPRPATGSSTSRTRSGIVTQALLDDGHRAIGLCNVAIGFQRRFAARFGVAPERVELEHVGLNHLTWERAVRVDGVDRLPELLDADGDELAEDSACRSSSSGRSGRSRPTTSATTTCSTRSSRSS